MNKDKPDLKNRFRLIKETEEALGYPLGKGDSMEIKEEFIDRLILVIRRRESEFDKVRNIYGNLLVKYESIMGINDEQAEALKLKLDRYQSELEIHIIAILHLKDIIHKMLDAA